MFQYIKRNEELVKYVSNRILIANIIVFVAADMLMYFAVEDFDITLKLLLVGFHIAVSILVGMISSDWFYGHKFVQNYKTYKIEADNKVVMYLKTDVDINDLKNHIEERYGIDKSYFYEEIDEMPEIAKIEKRSV